MSHLIMILALLFSAVSLSIQVRFLYVGITKEKQEAEENRKRAIDEMLLILPRLKLERAYDILKMPKLALVKEGKFDFKRASDFSFKIAASALRTFWNHRSGYHIIEQLDIEEMASRAVEAYGAEAIHLANSLCEQENHDHFLRFKAEVEHVLHARFGEVPKLLPIGAKEIMQRGYQALGI